jgi:hypothetical protein
LWSGIFEPGYLTFEALEQMLAEADAATAPSCRRI